jgi:hypothetical protein
MVANLLDFLHGLVKILGQSMGQLHLVGKATYVITTFSRYHLSIDSFMGSAWKAPVLGMLHLAIFLVAQRGQVFSCSIVNSSLEDPPRCDSLDHLVNTAHTIDRRPIIQDHPYMPEIGVPS